MSALSYSNSVEFPMKRSNSSQTLMKASLAMPHSDSLDLSYTSESSTSASKDRSNDRSSSSQSKSRSSSGNSRPIARSKQCNICGSAFSFTTKATECTKCGQPTCVKHCLNKWKGQVICDSCHKNCLFDEMLSRGEIEDADRLQAQIKQMANEKERWHVINREVDLDISQKRKELIDAEIEEALEIQKLKEQLESEKQRTLVIVNMTHKLTETVQGSKLCEQLTASKVRENTAQVEANQRELDIFKDTVRQLSDKLALLTREYNGMVSVKQLLSTVCRSCKTKVRQTFRRQIVEGNFSDAFSTFSRISRLEMNRMSKTEMKKENCKCLLM